MLYMLEIRRITMIDKKFWGNVAEEWKKDSDGIEIPDIDSSGISDIDPDTIPINGVSDSEIDDILAELGLDEI